MTLKLIWKVLSIKSWYNMKPWVVFTCSTNYAHIGPLGSIETVIEKFVFLSVYTTIRFKFEFYCKGIFRNYVSKTFLYVPLNFFGIAIWQKFSIWRNHTTVFVNRSLASIVFHNVFASLIFIKLLFDLYLLIRLVFLPLDHELLLYLFFIFPKLLYHVRYFVS